MLRILPLLCALTVPAAALAQDPAGAGEPLSLRVRAGFDGLYTLGRWVPIRVEAENRGLDRAGELVLEWGRVTYRQALTLPAPSRKQLTFYVRAADMRDRLELVFRGDAGETLARLDVTAHGLLPDEGLHVATIAAPVDPPAGARVAFLGVADMPADWRAYDGVDEVHAGAALPRDTASALAQWRRSRTIADVTDALHAAALDRAASHPIEQARWSLLGWYALTVTAIGLVVPILARRAWIVYAASFVAATVFTALALTIGTRALGAEGTVHVASETHQGPEWPARFVTTAGIVRPAARAEAVVRASSPGILLDASSELPAYEVRYAEDGTASLLVRASVGESFSVLARGFTREGDGADSGLAGAPRD